MSSLIGWYIQPYLIITIFVSLFLVLTDRSKEDWCFGIKKEEENIAHWSACKLILKYSKFWTIKNEG